MPGASRYETRSPRVGRLVDDAWAGHEIRSLTELERLATRSGREATDAVIALVDWNVMHGDPQRAIERLAALRRLPRDGRVLLDEALRMTGVVPADPLADVNARLRRRKLPSISSPSGTLNDLRCTSDASSVDGPRVTVIVPAHNMATTVGSTIRSLLAQTWRNLEIVVVDDASTDGTADIVSAIDDPQVVLLRQPENRGAYAARNLALANATGEFVTVNDADDWAHPHKIAVQMLRHLAQPAVVATTTALVRITDDLRVVRRGLPHGRFVGYNHASLMARTSTIRELGGWDEVRFGADSELEARLVAVHDSKSIVRMLDDTPLTLARSDASSLTRSPITGLGSSRFSTGARNLYTQAATHWHTTLTTNTARLQRTSDTKPFPVPSIVRRKTTGNSLFDVVMLSDFALPGGTTSSNLAEITANEQAGWSTAIVHNRNPRFRDTGISPKFFSVCSDLTRLVAAGESVSCDVLVIKYPPSALRLPDVFPAIEVSHEVVMIANQTPRTGYTGDRDGVYDIEAVDREVTSRFGRSPLWFPIGPAIRHVFETHHADEVAHIRWSADDWFEIIDAEAWRRPGRPENAGAFRVGRHGRDSKWKWPIDRTVFADAYPEHPPYVIDILGGADEATKRLGRIPRNWQVRPFDSISPHDYLAQLDVFVHVAHPHMEEAFGRTILEALAAGVPVITEPRFAGPFGKAVIASEPGDITVHLERLRSDPAFYDEMVKRGDTLVAERFGFSAHHQRIDELRR
ncbi:MAG: glycosyltransferase [Ilumatobacteraceae bacterium]